MGIFDTFVNLFFKDTPERRFQRQVQGRIRELSSLRPPAMERKSEWVHAAFIEHLHEIFLPMLPTLQLLKLEIHEKKGMAVRRYLVESITHENQRKILGMLEEAEIVKAAREISKKEFYLTMENALKTFMSLYQEEEKDRVNLYYNRLQALAKLGEYDFPLLFKDFDPNYNAENPAYKPDFSSKDGKYFVEDFKAIHRGIMASIFDEELLEVLQAFYTSLGREAPDLKRLRVSFKRLEELKSNQVFDKLLQVLSRDFDYKPEFLVFNDSIIIGLIDGLIQEKRDLVESAFGRIKSDHVAKLQERLFGTETAPPLRHYTPKQNATFASHDISIFEYAAELDLVKAFLILKWSKVLREFVNNLIVRGKFKDIAAQKALNDVYHQMNEMLTAIQRFDEELGESGKYGSRIKVLLLSTKKDRKSSVALGELVDECNKQAKERISEAILATKNLMDLFTRLDDAYREQSKRMLLNVLEWDGGRTAQSYQRMKAFAQDILVFLNMLKSLSSS
ncbi:MAG: hypothetical protein J0L75_01800 [Spirochaetes bacterium]|nr:hypothetical protein [Spirochaetota bacterium]